MLPPFISVSVARPAASLFVWHSSDSDLHAQRMLEFFGAFLRRDRKCPELFCILEIPTDSALAFLRSGIFA